MTATEAAEKLTKAFNLDPPLPNKWNVIDTMAKKLGASAEAMIANKGALVQSERLGFSNGGGMFDPAKKYPEIDSLEKAEEFLKTEEGKGVTGYGNILSLDDLSNAFATGGDAPGNPYIREAYRKATVGVGGGKDDEEARSKYQSAYKRAIAKGNEGAAGYGDYIRGRGDVRADYFKGTELNKTLDPNLHDTSVYNQVLQGKNVDGTILVGYTDADGKFQPLIANDAKKALEMGIVAGYGYTPEEEEETTEETTTPMLLHL